MPTHLARLFDFAALVLAISYERFQAGKVQLPSCCTLRHILFATEATIVDQHV